jgi:hypothetical protein
MRNTKKYGRAVPPKKEPFRYRAVELKGILRLCERCLQKKRRCDESKRYKLRDRSWKSYRRTQYKVYG